MSPSGTFESVGAVAPKLVTAPPFQITINCGDAPTSQHKIMLAFACGKFELTDESMANPAGDGGVSTVVVLCVAVMRILSRPSGAITRAVGASTFKAVRHVVPSSETLTAKSSFPAKPISARPEKFVRYKRLDVSLAVALLILS